MDCWATIVVICLTSITSILGTGVFYYLFTHRFKFPYNNISSFWPMIIVIITVIFQITEMILIITKSDNKYVARTVSFYYFIPVILITFIARSHSVGQCFGYNYFYLSKNYDESKKRKNFNQNYHIKFYKRTFTYSHFFGCVGVIYSIILILLITNEYPRVFLMIIFNYENNENNKKADDNSIFKSSLVAFALYGILLLILFGLIARIIRFKLKKDKFYFFLEFLGIGLISLTLLDIKSFIVIALKKNEENLPTLNLIGLIFDSVFYLFVILLYGLVTYLRKIQYSNANYLDFTGDFTSFMTRDVTLKLMKNYISHNHKDKYKLLCFWIDCYLYKDTAMAAQNKYNELCIKKKITNKKLRKLSDDLSFDSQEVSLINRNEEHVKRMAKSIFLEYFGNNLSYNQSDSHNKSCLFLIEFPPDIYGDVEEMYKTNFDIDNLENIFDEPLKWVGSQLETIYNEILSNEQEKEKIQRVLFFVDIFELNLNSA